MKTKSILLVVAALTLLINACGKKDSTTTPSVTTPSDGSQNAASLASNSQYCEHFGSIGSVYSSKNFMRALTIGADGSYQYSVRINHDNTTCVTPMTPDGSQEILVYTQSGTFSTNGIATAPSTGTKITFTPTSATLTIRSGYDSGALAGWLNACSGTPTFSTSGNTTRTMNGNICNGNGSYALGDFPILNNPIYNVIEKINIVRTGARINLWNPGAYTVNSVGTSFTDTYIIY